MDVFVLVLWGRGTGAFVKGSLATRALDPDLFRPIASAAAAAAAAVSAINMYHVLMLLL